MAVPFSDTTEAANTAASVTVHEKRGLCVTLRDLTWSYIGGAVTGKLTITGRNSGWHWEWDINGQGYGAYTISRDGLRFENGEPVDIVLAAGGVGVTGKLNVSATWEPDD